MAPQDSFIEEEADSCPLCIEEFDLSDRTFRPCPCGYQVCQFCFNNIKNNMNGLCPACRRPYDEKTIEWKVVTPDEVALFRANIQKNQKKRAQDQRLKEVQKREAEKENRKNLIGVRVVQKNLVYITGLAPTVKEDELLKTLRKPEFFGQYGNIQKISISNRRSSDGQHQSLGIYVTFERPEEATRCIQAVHGSHNGERTLKAQHGTTKYCSAWLKNEKCSNPGCMFLHEQGDEEDSYTRQDLSSMNSILTQRPLPGGGSSSSRTASRALPVPQPQAPVSQPMARSGSRDDSDNGIDSSALPSSASWARNPQRSRRGSYATSGAASSPAVSNAIPAVAESTQDTVEEEPSSHYSEASAPETRKDVPDDAFGQLLRSLAQALHGNTYKDSADDLEDLGVPMFDLGGGEKRRVMREEEDLRLAGEQGDQPDVREASEGEPEAGGSLALGGEPEDREAGPSTHGFDQRWLGIQPPIQRAAGESPLGPGLGNMGFNHNTNPVGRTMTPQQISTMRSQSGFGDPLSPSISGQTQGFQGQGHNRQSSRFNFANENTPTATNVKLAANPRIMAQQSSMMPNSFQTQGGNQFYGGSMPGPPPGLKSTGTPPNMFGQGFSGAGFGGAPKDSSNELLQSLIGRGRAGNDAGKREYMIPSVPSPYPPSSTSTPAPASGFLGPLYGNQPGPFQDFGHKQKKKGKKHRHANTSSTGGSGLVDLADPSILQARMQQQSQSNTGAGQGLFGQSQDDTLPSLAETAVSVDALVADDYDVASPRGSPTAATQGAGDSWDGPHSHPEPSMFLATTRSSLDAPRITPALPTLPPPPGLGRTLVKPDQIRATRPEHATGMAPIASNTHAHPEPPTGLLQDEDFPALGAVKAKGHSATPRSQTPKPAAKKPSEKAPTKVLDVPELASSKDDKSRGPVAKQAIAIDTARMSPVADSLASTTDTPVSGSQEMFPPLPASTPSARAAPKTLRLVANTKLETPPPESPSLTATSSASASAIASRAVSALQRPDTPVSEMVSDTASVVSASVSASRAGSPPPSKVGSAAVRTATKSQVRKQRKEATKQESKVIAEAPKAEPEIHAPILGRMKKQKKEKPAKATAKIDPKSQEVKAADDHERETVQSSQSRASIVEPIVPPPNAAKPAKGKERAATKDKVQEQPIFIPEPIESDTPVEIPQGPSSVFADIKESLWSSQESKLLFLKQIANGSARASQDVARVSAGTSPCGESPCRCGEIQDEDLTTLRSGKPVRKQFHTDGSRMLITPNGDCVRGLTAEEEDLFLQLQVSIAESADHPGAFVAPRHQPSNGGAFSLIKGRAVPNGRPSIFPVAPLPQSQDPLVKIQREDALSYINQYVLPRLSLGAANPGAPKGTSPTRDAAAASLNSLAPYFYGPDAAAGVGIYSPTDGARALQDFGSHHAHGQDGAKVPGVSGVPSMPLMSVEDAETALALARKETDKMEKSLNALLKRNRRILLSGSA